jgi:hypothetical protein
MLLSLCVPALLVGLAHLNSHVLGGATFDWMRLILPAAIGPGPGLLLCGDLNRNRQLGRAARDLRAPRDKALHIAVVRGPETGWVLARLERAARGPPVRAAEAAGT